MEELEIETYVRQNLLAELQEMLQAGFAAAYPDAALSDCEKALIYYYTCDGPGYRDLNRALHTSGGNNESPLGRGIVAALEKLPAFARLVYSGVHLTDDQLVEYVEGATVCWHSFLSTSTFHKVAVEFLNYGDPSRPKNALFLIKSNTGRRIGELSYFGPNGPGRKDSESEVLFMPNTSFIIRRRTDTGTETGVIELELDELFRVR